MAKEIPEVAYTLDEIEDMERENELEIEAVDEWEQEMQDTGMSAVGFRGDDERDLEEPEDLS